jgi:hypothetical protein
MTCLIIALGLTDSVGHKELVNKSVIGWREGAENVLSD